MSAGWLPAKMLQAGMTLVNRDNEQTLKVVSQTKLDKTDTVYNFEVDEFHTYHIGEFGVWVHNSCADNLLKGYKGQKLSYGSNVITIDKSGIKHILERHHPNYWDGSVKTDQTFLDKSMSVNDIEKGIKSILGQNSSLLRSGKRDGQIEGLYNGKRYVLGLRDGVVGQFYPK